jgi:hypothetical protein
LNISNTYNIKKISKKINNLYYLDCHKSNIMNIPIILNKLVYLNIVDTNIIYKYYETNNIILYKHINL